MNTNTAKQEADTIVAPATARGKAGVAIIRISGDSSHLKSIIQQVTNKELKTHKATFSKFYQSSGQVIDEGIAIYFQAPRSFTGEDVLELQGHGGAIVTDQIIKRIVQLGARLAEPGEFSQRAFLNGKLDLTQVEAVAGLIDASSEQAAKAAINSLQGKFSEEINKMVADLTAVRVQVEAGIDFAEEDIDLTSMQKISERLKSVEQSVYRIIEKAQAGCLLAEGVNIAIIGPPNAGKSSLLNRLAERDIAIVTQEPGTTRDVLSQSLVLKHIPVNIIDTAGIRETLDPIEAEGIRRAKQARDLADKVVLVLDAIEHTSQELIDRACQQVGLYEFSNKQVLTVMNKADLLPTSALPSSTDVDSSIFVSALTGIGIDKLIDAMTGTEETVTGEGIFMARRRHLTALDKAKKHIQESMQYMQTRQLELLAEELRLSQLELSSITGAFSSDDLLGEIFSNFCIGK